MRLPRRNACATQSLLYRQLQQRMPPNSARCSTAHFNMPPRRGVCYVVTVAEARAPSPALIPQKCVVGGGTTPRLSQAALSQTPALSVFVYARFPRLWQACHLRRAAEYVAPLVACLSTYAAIHRLSTSRQHTDLVSDRQHMLSKDKDSCSAAVLSSSSYMLRGEEPFVTEIEQVYIYSGERHERFLSRDSSILKPAARLRRPRGKHSPLMLMPSR